MNSIFKTLPAAALLALSACASGPLSGAEGAFRRGRYSVAENRGKAALASAEAARDAAGIGEAAGFLAGLAAVQGRAPQAEGYYRQALAGFERSAADSAAVAATAFNLAATLSLQGKNVEAEPFYKRAVGLSDKPGVTPGELLDRLAGIGLFYEAQRRYDDAEPYYQRAVAAAQRLGGERLKKATADYEDLQFRKKAKGPK